jgi:hypothetical protein
VVFNFMKEIQLNTVQKTRPDYMRYKALVDDEDFEFLNQYKWRVQHDEHRMYVKTKINGKQVSMHVLLLGKKDGKVIDHKDGNGLNNQRLNLRFCTNQENCRNCRSYGSSSYYGVSINRTRVKNWSKSKGEWVYGKICIAWRTRIIIDGKNKWAGSFKTEIEAARKWDELAKIHYGEFARLNFPDN